MISLGKKFLFVHVPKTGGNSIQNVLREYSEDRIVAFAKHQDGVERFEVRSDRYDITKHSTLGRYREVLAPDTYRGLYKFATIRNPWDRMISFYFSPHRGSREWDREEFLKLVEGVLPLRHYIAVPSLADGILRRLRVPGFPRLGRLDGDLDFLMRFERLDEDFGLVCRRLGIPAVPLPRRNRSVRRHYSLYYDRQTREAVEEKFIEEIRFGGYEFRSP